jgi:hypothetical protein
VSTSGHDIVGSGPERVDQRYLFDPLIAVQPVAQSVAQPTDPEFSDRPSPAAQRLDVDFRRQILRIAIDDTKAGPAFTADQRNEFTSDLCGDLKRLESWAIEFGWVPGPVAQLSIFISDQHRISKSLVPAWSGYPGFMRFPASRIAERRAAILHELVHVFFPNGNRFLAEGLAIYLQARIGGNPAFPNFGRPLHDAVLDRCREMSSDCPGVATLQAVSLQELDAIPTPNALSLAIGDQFFGEGPRGQAVVYPIAGSFAQFLVETRGIESFRTLYIKTPLVVRAQNAGAADRWLDVYGEPLAKLDQDWKAHLGRGEHDDDLAPTEVPHHEHLITNGGDDA